MKIYFRPYAKDLDVILVRISNRDEEIIQVITLLRIIIHYLDIWIFANLSQECWYQISIISLPKYDRSS